MVKTTHDFCVVGSSTVWFSVINHEHYHVNPVEVHDLKIPAKEDYVGVKVRGKNDLSLDEGSVVMAVIEAKEAVVRVLDVGRSVKTNFIRGEDLSKANVISSIVPKLEDVEQDVAVDYYEEVFGDYLLYGVFSSVAQDRIVTSN